MLNGTPEASITPHATSLLMYFPSASPVVDHGDVLLPTGGGGHGQAGAQAACGCIGVPHPLTGAAGLHEVVGRDVCGDLYTQTHYTGSFHLLLAVLRRGTRLMQQ